MQPPVWLAHARLPDDLLVENSVRQPTQFDLHHKRLGRMLEK
jgi:hypothetical protein